MHLNHIVHTVILTIACSGVAYAQKTLIDHLKAGKPQTIVTYGTSLTAGGAWVWQLQAALDRQYPGLGKVINSGAGGMWSNWGVDNLEERVIAKKPDAVFIEFGINDAFLEYNTSTEAARKNLENMIGRILKANPRCQIILMTMNPPIGIHLERRPKVDEYYNVYRQTAKKHKLMLIDHNLNWVKVLKDEPSAFDKYVPDGIHPNEEGCKKVIIPQLLKSLSIEDPLSHLPSLDDMACEWIPMKDIVNPPAVHNFHDMLIAGYDLTSFSCSPGSDIIWWATSKKIYPAVKLFVGGKEYPATECRAYPYCALRRNPDCDGLSVLTDIRMINEKNAILCRIRITNPGASEKRSVISLQTPGRLHADNLTSLNPFQNDQDEFLKGKRLVTAVAPSPKPENAREDSGGVRWTWEITLPPGGEKVVEFVASHGEVKDTGQVLTQVTGWSQRFGTEFDACKTAWEGRWADAFTPGNTHFSGNLPVLVTDNAALKRNYYMGVITMLTLERTQFTIHPRSFITSGERGPGTQYFWDACMQATAWALLEPKGMKAVLKRWLVQNIRTSVVITLDWTSGYNSVKSDQITGYAFTACNFFQATLDYLRVTRDFAFLDFKLENGQSVMERLDEIATDWKTLALPGSPLANYGENSNLLECAPAYIHRVPSLNAQNVWMMRQAAMLHDMRKNAARATELRNEAACFLPAVLALYKPDDGVWYGVHKDGTRVELRHCVDYIYVGKALANDLSPTMRNEMTAFVKRELLMRDWMRAMSQKDAAAANSERPDHGPMGAYDGWISMTVGAMWKLGYQQDAFEFYCRTAVVTKEGPFAQAHEFYGPNRATYDSPVRVAYDQGCLKECISGASFADVVINTFFGFSPPLNGKALIEDPNAPRPFEGTLIGVRYGDHLYRLSADKHGVRTTVSGSK